jgi:hypothetical protein
MQALREELRLETTKNGLQNLQKSAKNIEKSS